MNTSARKRGNSSVQDNSSDNVEQMSTGRSDEAAIKANVKCSLILPPKFTDLMEVFVSVDIITSDKFPQNEITFDQLKNDVQERFQRNIDTSQLNKIIAVYPESYEWLTDRVRTPESNEEKHELVIRRLPHTVERKRKTKRKRKTELLVLTNAERRKIFQDRLLNRTKTSHQDFLSKLGVLEDQNPAKMKEWHPEFNLDNVPDIEPVPSPQLPIQQEIFSANTGLENTDDLISGNKHTEQVVIVIAEQKQETEGSVPSDTNTAMNIPDSLPAFQRDLENVPKTSLQLGISVSNQEQDMSTAGNISPRSEIANTSTEQLLMDTTAHKFAVVRNYPAYVDKSPLIKTVIDGERYIALVAPRRFGKTVNLDMLRCFFQRSNDPTVMETNKRLFENLLINQKYPEIMNQHCGKYPIICLDFRPEVTIKTYDKAFAVVRDVIHRAYRVHDYLEFSEAIKARPGDILYIKRWCNPVDYKSIATEDTDINQGLKNLVEFLCKHFGVEKVNVFIDEYDSTCTKAVLDVEDIIDKVSGKVIQKADAIIKQIVELCVGLIECVAKANQSVERVILTGISYLMTIGLSNLGNVKVYRFQEKHAYSKYYGLNSSEIQKLIEDHSLNVDFEAIKNYYNGYANETYSTVAVMSYFNSSKLPTGPKLDNYWKESGMIHNLDQALHVPCIKSIISQLSVNLSNQIEIVKYKKLNYTDLFRLAAILKKTDPNISNTDIFFNFLLEQGYFSIVEEKEKGHKVVVRIPNQEIISEFREKFLKFYEDNYRLDVNSVKECAGVFDKMCSSNKENETNFKEIFRLLNKILKSFVFPSQNEATFHHVIFIVLFFCMEFDCFSEVQSSEKTKKILDLCLLNLKKQIGIILELKCKKDADTALEQILDKRYDLAFQNEKYNPNKVEIKYKIYVGIDMSSEQVVTMSLLLNETDMSKKIDFR